MDGQQNKSPTENLTPTEMPQGKLFIELRDSHPVYYLQECRSDTRFTDKIVINLVTIHALRLSAGILKYVRVLINQNTNTLKECIQALCFTLIEYNRYATLPEARQSLGSLARRPERKEKPRNKAPIQQRQTQESTLSAIIIPNPDDKNISERTQSTTDRATWRHRSPAFVLRQQDLSNPEPSHPTTARPEQPGAQPSYNSKTCATRSPAILRQQDLRHPTQLKHEKKNL
ncbi:hypothetical protein STEG23_018525 [Scotinomys teguina]